jgi:GNAT superfamily N-acetyltransferase
MIVRPTTEHDWEALKAIRLAALLDAPAAFGVRHADAAAYADAQWRERAASGRFQLAFDDGRPVGIAAGVESGEGEFNLIAMWVSPASRGTQAAARLVEAVKARALELGHRRVVLGVARENARAVAFYVRQGFAFIDEWEPIDSQPGLMAQKMAWCAA